MVLDFYNARRQNIANVKPNKAHKILADLEKDFEVNIVTQNIDNLHEQGGSTNVLHLHGEITKACSSNTKRHIKDIGFTDIKDGDLCPDGYQLRPLIVWFGEDVQLISRASELVRLSNILLVIGTSLEVYPAAGLIKDTQPNVPIYVIDPSDILDKIQVSNKMTHIQKRGSEGMSELLEILRKL